jgi:hydroxymethylpyrimidine pyrophosphatase-like HAD family hydrolase
MADRQPKGRSCRARNPHGPDLADGGPGLYRGAISGVGKIVGPSDDHAKVARVTELMQQALAGRARAARSQAYYCDVIPHGIDKGRLVEVLAQRVGVPPSEILVLGDMENDLEMFRKAGFAVAMGNATDAVKRAAQACRTKRTASRRRSNVTFSTAEPHSQKKRPPGGGLFLASGKSRLSSRRPE